MFTLESFSRLILTTFMRFSSFDLHELGIRYKCCAYTTLFLRAAQRHLGFRAKRDPEGLKVVKAYTDL